jgi:hypothetical protein
MEAYMQKWEYTTVRLDHGSDQIILRVGKPMNGINDWMDRMGAKGWELVSATSSSDYSDQARLYLKRPLEKAAHKD